MTDQCSIHDFIKNTEFEARLHRVRTRMEQHGFDALIVTDPCNIYYLTGYDGWSFYTPQALLVFPDEAPLLIVRKMDVAGAHMTSCLDEAQVIGYDEALVQSPNGHPFERVAEVLKQTLKGPCPVLGIESESYYFSVRAYHVLESLLPNATLKDSGFLVNWVRFIKSPAEIGLLEQAGALLTHSMMETIAAIESGVSQSVAVGRAYQSNIEGAGAFGGNYTSSPAFFLAGERIKTPHLPWSDTPIESGTQINLELMGNRLRYQCTIGRTVHVGPPPAKLRELEAIVSEALSEALAFMRPGVSCHAVADRLYRFLAKKGIHKDSRCGYSLGIAYPPTGGELTASFRRDDQTILEPGAVMHFLPAIWSDDVSIIMSEPVVITARGATPLCTIPRELFIRD